MPPTTTRELSFCRSGRIPRRLKIMEWLRLRPRNDRWLRLYGGIAFVLAGGVAAIALNQPEQQPASYVPPVMLTGRVVSLARGVGRDNLPVVLRPSRSAMSDRRGEDCKTDPLGNFQLRGHYRGPADVFVVPEPADPWTCRPVWSTHVPAAKPIQIDLIQGACVRGRLVREGKPVTDVPVQLFLDDRFSPLLLVLGVHDLQRWETSPNRHGGVSSARFLYQAARQTRSDREGFFVFGNLPENANFWVHSRLGKLPDEGAFAPRKAQTGQDKTELDLGDVEVRRGRRLSGRVVFPGGTTPDIGLGIDATQPYPASSYWSKLDELGQFELSGLHDGPVRVRIAFPIGGGIARLGIRLSPLNRCLDPQTQDALVGQLDRDITALTILCEKGQVPEPLQDPAVLAAFQKASAGPITGIVTASGRAVE
jgi:hypothetical protein